MSGLLSRTVMKVCIASYSVHVPCPEISQPLAVDSVTPHLNDPRQTVSLKPATGGYSVPEGGDPSYLIGVARVSTFWHALHTIIPPAAGEDEVEQWRSRSLVPRLLPCFCRIHHTVCNKMPGKACVPVDWVPDVNTPKN